MKNYFIFKIKKKLFLEIKKNNFNLIKNSNFSWIIKTLKKNFLKIKSKIISIETTLKLLISFVVLKDLTLFLNWLKFILEKLELRFHKNFFNYIFFLFKTLNFYFIKNFNYLGTKIIINGKIGVGGGVKTKSLLLNLGKNSLNNKNLKLDFEKIQIKTKSGIIGLKLYLLYSN